MRGHEEFTDVVAATIDAAFTHLDDQTRLSAHMSKRSWKMGWGRMDVRLDEQRGKAIGSHIVLDGRVFGIRLYLEEVVTQRDPPHHKGWATLGEPHLLVIGQYTMGFNVSEAEGRTRVRVVIDYDLPTRGFPRLLGVLFGRMYAKWCTRQMVQDAQRAFADQARSYAAQQRINTMS
jgi:hypothetical protein